MTYFAKVSQGYATRSIENLLGDKFHYFNGNKDVYQIKTGWRTYEFVFAVYDKIRRQMTMLAFSRTGHTSIGTTSNYDPADVYAFIGNLMKQNSKFDMQAIKDAMDSPKTRRSLDVHTQSAWLELKYKYADHFYPEDVGDTEEKSEKG